MKKADKILIVCIMIVAVVLCVPLFFSKNENVYASVYVKEKQVLRIDLSKDKTYVVNGKLGKVHIEVKQKKVRVTQEKSPHHYVRNKVMFRMPMFPLYVCPMRQW